MQLLVARVSTELPVSGLRGAAGLQVVVIVAQLVVPEGRPGVVREVLLHQVELVFDRGHKMK